MNTFVVACAQEGTRPLDAAWGEIESRIPTEWSQKRLWTSTSGRTQAAFYEVETRLFPGGASWFSDARGVTFFDGFIWPTHYDSDVLSDAAARLHGELLSFSTSQVRADTTGEYSLVHIDDRTDELTALVDPVGVSSLYLYEGRDVVVVSNRIDLIAACVGEERLPLDLDILAWHATWGLIPPRVTIRQGVRQIYAGDVLTVRHGRANLQTTARPIVDMPGAPKDQQVTDAVWDELIEELCSNLRFIKHRDGITPTLGLSGGKDSRLILALAIHEGVADRILFFTQGVHEHPDVIVAKEITRRLGLFHLIQEPKGSVVGAKRIFEEAMPKHMYYSEGMLSVYDPHATSRCGGDPMLTGLNGDNFRSSWDMHGHDTTGVVDRESARQFFEHHVWVDPAGVVRGEICERHVQQRHRWISEQLAAGVNPADLPGLFYTQFQSLRRNCNARKVNGCWHHTINVLNGRLIYWLAFHLGSEARRRETIHFSLMNRISPWLARHHFAEEAWWEGHLGGVPAPTPVTAAPGTAQRAIQRAEWQTHIDTVPEFRSLVKEYLLSFGPDHRFWDIIDRSKIEQWFAQAAHPRMSRFGLFGAVTIAMALDGRQNLVRMRRSAEARPTFVRAEGDERVYAVTGGRLHHIPNVEGLHTMGAGWADVQVVPLDVLKRLPVG